MGKQPEAIAKEKDIVRDAETKGWKKSGVQ